MSNNIYSTHQSSISLNKWASVARVLAAFCYVLTPVAFFVACVVASDGGGDGLFFAPFYFLAGGIALSLAKVVLNGFNVIVTYYEYQMADKVAKAEASNAEKK